MLAAVFRRAMLSISDRSVGGVEKTREIRRWMSKNLVVGQDDNDETGGRRRKKAGRNHQLSFSRLCFNL